MDLHPGTKTYRVAEVKFADLDSIRQALHENADWYQDLVEHSQDLLCIHDLQGRLLSVNPAPARVLGYSVEELLKIPMRELIVPEFRADFDAYLKDIAITGESHGWMGVVTRSGEQRIWEYHNTLRTEGVASPIVRGMARDVTEQRRAEQLAREANETLHNQARENERTIEELKLFRTLVDQSNDAIEVVDPETLRFLDVNEKACSALGYSREELLSLRVFDINPAVTESSMVPIRQQWRETGWLVLEGVHRRKDGSIFPVEVSTKQVLAGRDYIVAIARDLTERKQAEEKLKVSESRYRALHEISPVGVCWIDSQTGRFFGVNPKYCEIVGRTEHDLLGRTFQSITHPEDLAENLERLRQLKEGEVRQYQLEKRYVRPDGSVRWVDLEVVPMWPEDHDPVWHMAIVQDITERKQADARLREYERVVEVLGDRIMVVDREYRYVIANAAFLNYRGLGKEQVIGRTVAEVVGREVFEADIKQQFDECFQGRVVRYEVRYAYPKLGERDVSASYFPIQGPTGIDQIACVLRDTTEQKRAEEALRQNLAQLQEVTEELRVAKEKLSEEKLYLEESIDTELGFGEIVGRSSALKEVMRKVAKVAPSDATVLLQGETGTGKELVARAIHRMSRREGNSFIKLNCAAIPSGLLESELFGHEKGAFTGAVARKLGRLELADRGTLFMDEIGEIPLSLQPKLLRVLQDLEFERLGGTQTLKVNFRLLAATNRDLVQSVKGREFRSDLYYRLNVFPILIPPLRERREDIRPLIEHFVSKFAAQMKKSITSIPSKTMEMMVRWNWPGNIRELENFVERSVILTPGSVLQAPLAELETVVEQGSAGASGSVRDKERERILRALRDCHGKLGGPDGAAARLGFKRTTLQSKLDQFGIKPGSYRA
ncbi:MAG: PAS domain S-box protein [Candidatus Sulfotelmatobacter sp.]